MGDVTLGEAPASGTAPWCGATWRRSSSAPRPISRTARSVAHGGEPDNSGLWGSRSPRSSGNEKGTIVEHARCAYCRNPIRGRQARVQLARIDMAFHADCWTTMHDEVQTGYRDRARDEGGRRVGRSLPSQRCRLVAARGRHRRCRRGPPGPGRAAPQHRGGRGLGRAGSDAGARGARRTRPTPRPPTYRTPRWSTTRSRTRSRRHLRTSERCTPAPRSRSGRTASGIRPLRHR